MTECLVLSQIKWETSTPPAQSREILLCNAGAAPIPEPEPDAAVARVFVLAFAFALAVGLGSGGSGPLPVALVRLSGPVFAVVLERKLGA